jgi:hypothetical protein
MDKNDDVDYSALWALFQETRTVVEGRWFSGQTLDLDGYHFKRCRFDNCALSYKTGDFQFTECLLGGASISHPAMALPIIRLFMVAFPTLDRLWPPFTPVRHADGTFSVNNQARPQ